MDVTANLPGYYISISPVRNWTKIDEINIIVIVLVKELGKSVLFWIILPVSAPREGQICIILDYPTCICSVVLTGSIAVVFGGIF